MTCPQCEFAAATRDACRAIDAFSSLAKAIIEGAVRGLTENQRDIYHQLVARDEPMLDALKKARRAYQ